MISDLDQIIKKLILRNEQGEKPITLLAVCPNSEAVLEAAVRAASRNRSIMLFAATLNQVDFEDSYTGWTPAGFVQKMNKYAAKYNWDGPLYPCLDHGGPWLKDLHTLRNLAYDETMDKVKKSITACIMAGYRLLHIDPTVDRSYPKGEALPIELVVERTVELIDHAERIRSSSGIARLCYEVGTEEVHGGLVDTIRFDSFIALLREKLLDSGLSKSWPCLFVAQIGTDLHTTQFDPAVARKLNAKLAPLGSMIKGHYTDWVNNPAEYPASAMGAANVGPEFTAEEFSALQELERREKEIIKHDNTHPSSFMGALQDAVISSGRWKKWLLPDEAGFEFNDLPDDRKLWLLQTGSRYIWTDGRVVEARNRLYQNLSAEITDPHGIVVEKITIVIEKYITAFNLKDSCIILA